jgi:hypothetical protein
MLKFRTLVETSPLQNRFWPAVPPFRGLSPDFSAFLELGLDRQAEWLAGLRNDVDTHSARLHEFLSVVSAYLFGYPDSPLFRQVDDKREAQILTAKLSLERELLDYWLTVEDVPESLGQEDAAAYLESLSKDNPSLTHPLFDYIQHAADRAALSTFLRNEVTRNEVVDDEVGMVLVGLQGPMKLAIASNLWDECGRGKLENFHTYWLRRLLEQTEDWEALLDYRNRRPWITQITTNTFNALLTRPGMRLMSYGWFLINESWVAPHFIRILDGMRRVGLSHEDIEIYFTAHVTIDPRHTDELTGALRAQRPMLSRLETAQVVRGAHLAIAASTAQYDRMLAYLNHITDGHQGT